MLLLVSCLLNSTVLLYRFLPSFGIFMLTALMLNLLTALPFLTSSRGLILTTCYFWWIQILPASVSQHPDSFIPHAGSLWNSLLSSGFPPACDLNSHKRRVSEHLSTRNWSIFWPLVNFFSFFGAVRAAYRKLDRDFLLLICFSFVFCWWFFFSSSCVFF